MTPLARRAHAVLWLSLVTFALLAGAAIAVPTHAFEVTLRQALVSLDDGGRFGEFLRTIDHAGTWRVILPGTLIVFAVFPRARAYWWIWAVTFLAAPAVETLFKFVIGRPRPEDISTGFPSGHATAAAAFFGALIYLSAPLPTPRRRTVRVVAVVCIVMVGVARVALRAHWPTDAIAGTALGLMLSSTAFLLTDWRGRLGSTQRFPARAGPEPTRPPSRTAGG